MGQPAPAQLSFPSLSLVLSPDPVNAEAELCSPRFPPVSPQARVSRTPGALLPAPMT